ncbi:MAG: hypothetical protein MUC29_09840 [Pyrinomonadaceae bacterium]|jgi:hypothetical protein|nr:hypothetical protein [Pyrinomonadaceae bacterium]
MGKIINSYSILGLALIISAMVTTAFSQATSITKAEFDKEIDKAWKTTISTFPRRETYSNLQEFEDEDDEIEGKYNLILSQLQIREFLAKDRIRYEFIETMETGKTVTKKLLIGSQCYELEGKIWEKTPISCDPQSFRIDAEPAKEEFFVENSTLNSNSVKILRKIETFAFRNEEITFDEYVYYLDSESRMLKREYFAKRGERKRELLKSTVYEYDIRIAPINPPFTPNNKKKR